MKMQAEHISRETTDEECERFRAFLALRGIEDPNILTLPDPEFFALAQEWLQSETSDV